MADKQEAVVAASPTADPAGEKKHLERHKSASPMDLIRWLGRVNLEYSKKNLIFDLSKLAIIPSICAIVILCLADQGNANWARFGFTCIITFHAMRLLSHKLIARIFRRNSVLFQHLSPAQQNHDIALLNMSMFTFAWLPITLYMLARTLTLGPIDTPAQFGGLGAVMLYTGVLDQFYELAWRKFDKMLTAHHLGETILALLVVEWLPIEGGRRLADVGIYCLAMQNSLDQAVKSLFFIDHLAVQNKHTMERIQKGEMKESEVKEFHGQLTKLDQAIRDPKFLRETLPTVYTWFFWGHVVLVRLFVYGCTIAYLVKFWPDIRLTWQVLLCIGIGFFFFIDFDTYVLLWQRSTLNPNLHKVLEKKHNLKATAEAPAPASAAAIELPAVPAATTAATPTPAAVTPASPTAAKSEEPAGVSIEVQPAENATASPTASTAAPAPAPAPVATATVVNA